MKKFWNNITRLTLVNIVVWLSIAMTVVAISVSLAGCKKASSGQGPSAEQKQRQQTEKLHAEASRQVGMPAITNFQELKFTKQIIEARDSEITTYTYTVDRSGGLHFVCQSVGYGLPYSTQMTNPVKDKWKSYDYRQGGSISSAVVDQPEPNGLYMPDNVSATWILCLDDSTGEVTPVYSEPELMVSPFELTSVSQYQKQE